MADRWFYAHEGTRSGPFTSGQFMALARNGAILTTDTVWLNDAEKGVEARKVRNLFPAAAEVVPTAIPPVPIEAPRAEERLGVPPEVAPPVVDAPPAKTELKPPPAYQDHHAARKLRAIGLNGATIISQDGRVVRFRKKCTTCGHEDSSYATMPITVGTMKAGFFCSKCRKHREVQMRGQQN